MATDFIVGRTWHDIALDAGVDAVSEGYLAAGTALLRETREDPELRAQRVEALGRAAVGRSGGITELLTEDATEADATDILLWLGRTLIDEAWQIRGGGWAETVGRDRFKLFRATLANAREPLLAAAELDTADPVPWECMQWLALGLELERDHKDAIWRNIAERCPTLMSAHWGRLQVLAEKWGGSHEEMFDFARQVVDAAPAGQPLTAMLPLAHAEYLLRERRPLLESGESRAFVRFSVDHYTMEIVEELEAAANKWTATMAPHPRGLEAHHLFGAILADCGLDDAARPHLERVGDRLHVIPWSYLGAGSAGEEFSDALQRLGIA
ncbi:hypothetical protein HDA32_001552 [Spinactinospora alkalitolerans]|uniref:DUF4034 domain-containing protein n=1 Tax=Spinactinospora alkalitolerans TaxID=687207 RepID=A0A852TU87_9ACTN|nr:hypothetical protein [Spinactinospora alkalitolerans]NYE46432.1 hypothetical protein [Spinactinospora alkalitolerans]